MAKKKLTPISQSIKMMEEFKQKVIDRYPHQKLVVQAIDHCIEFSKECKIYEFNAMYDSWISARYGEISLEKTFTNYYESKYEEN
jgi:hypothetical protein